MSVIAWCYTMNNYTEEQFAAFQTIPAKYHVFGKEVGEAGTPHLQGYIELEKKMSMRQVKLLFGTDAIHLEGRKAKPFQAAEYCKKDGNFHEYGTAPTAPVEKESSKVRWLKVLRACQAGQWSWVEENEPYLWLLQEKRIRSHFKCPKSIDVLENEWIYGPTGTGKSRVARETYPDAYIKDASSHWWDGYNGEEVVIIDDLDKYHVKQGYYLKVWADHYAFPAQIKGGQQMIRPKKIIVTSNYSPEDIWQDSTTVDPIKRRFAMRYMGPDFVIPPPAQPFVFPPMFNFNDPEDADNEDEPMSQDPEFVRAADVLFNLSQSQ
nr:MAG: replication associated protein [Cressdnaviricota sp.]